MMRLILHSVAFNGASGCRGRQSRPDANHLLTWPV
jgi:hypothetical protein